MKYVDVITDVSAKAIDKTFCYSVPKDMSPERGSLVRIPFGPRDIHGFVLRINDEPPSDLSADKIKPIRGVLDPGLGLLPDQIALAYWMHDRYLCSLSGALKLMTIPGIRTETVHEKTLRQIALADASKADAYRLAHHRAARQLAVLDELADHPMPLSEIPSAILKAFRDNGIVRDVSVSVNRTPSVLSGNDETPDPPLTQEQQHAFDKLWENDGKGCYLLHGITGSGKTELYIRTIRRILAQGRGAIVLVPEIALTPQLSQWFKKRFGSAAAVLHSALSEGERRDEWCRIRSGEARVVIGARSAVFAPVPDLGIVIVDEEHEGSYQSDREPRYDAREVARFRAENAQGMLILGSATPSLSTYMKAMPGVRPENSLRLVEMHRRANGKPLPHARIIDMRNEYAQGNSGIFSADMRRELENCLTHDEQAILFMNRRGFSTFVSCRSCGKAVKCDNCDITMTYHQSEGKLICHYCGSEKPLPASCPVCGSRAIKHFGAGTEKVEEELLRIFPGTSVVRMDADTTRTKDSHQRIYDTFKSGKARILIGTQMIAKGLDFPGVSLVGVIAADMSLNLPDYRSAERTFQLITQAAGRAGRAGTDGKVIIQTYDPDHYAIRFAAKQDYRAFYLKEVQYRKLALYPPYTTIMRIVFSAKTEDVVRQAAQECETTLQNFAAEHCMQKDIIQIRALEAPVKLLKGEYRWQLFAKMYFKGDIQAMTGEMQRLTAEKNGNIRAEFEVNPNNLL